MNAAQNNPRIISKRFLSHNTAKNYNPFWMSDARGFSQKRKKSRHLFSVFPQHPAQRERACFYLKKAFEEQGAS